MQAWNDLKKRVSVGLGATYEEETTEKVRRSTRNTRNINNNRQSNTENVRANIPYINSSKWYQSNTYKSLFSSKKSSKWITKGIAPYLDSNYNKYDDNNLQQLILKQPDKHPFSDVVQDALNILNEWREWKNLHKNSGGRKEWKLSSSERVVLDSYTDTRLNCYWNTISDSAISATKGEMILPYSVPIICGIIENSEHECKYEEYSDKIHEIEQLSQHSQLLYAQTKTPMFISERDIFGIGFNYVLPNAEVIMGCRSIDRLDERLDDYQDIVDRYRGNKEYVRAYYTLDLYHLRPWYERNSNYTVVTYYSHLDLCGSIPNWMINGMVSDTPKIILSLKKYIDDNIDLLSRDGQLHIPLRMLEYVGVYPEDTMYRVPRRPDIDSSDDDDQKLQYAFDDNELSEPKEDDVSIHSVGSEKDKLDNIKFVDVTSKSDSKRYLQQPKDAEYDDLYTPIPTPDLERAKREGNGNESDLGRDDETQKEEEEVTDRNIRMKSGIYDFQNMDFAFDDDDLSDGNINSANMYKNDEFVDIKTKTIQRNSVVNIKLEEIDLYDNNDDDDDDHKGNEEDEKLKYAFDDDELSEPKEDAISIHSIGSEKDKLDNIPVTFVDVTSKSDSKMYIQQPKEAEYDDLHTPIPTPDLELAKREESEDDGDESLSDLRDDAAVVLEEEEEETNQQ